MLLVAQHPSDCAKLGIVFGISIEFCNINMDDCTVLCYFLPALTLDATLESVNWSRCGSGTLLQAALATVEGFHPVSMVPLPAIDPSQPVMSWKNASVVEPSQNSVLLQTTNDDAQV